jgi:peptide deformylase
MALLDIVLVGGKDAEVLRKRAHKVTVFDDRLGKLLDNMVETLGDAPGVGLAAPQINVSERLIVVRLPDDEQSRQEYGDQAGVLYEVVNPQIVRPSQDMVDGVEACLSIPGIFGNVSRHESVVVKGQTREGKKIRIKADGWLARVFQHEIDHLDGILFTDRADELWREEPADREAQPSPQEQAAPESGD